MGYTKQMQRKTVKTAGTDSTLDVVVVADDADIATKKAKKRNRNIPATQSVEADISIVQTLAVGRKKSKKKNIDVAGTEMPTYAVSDRQAVANSRQKGDNNLDTAEIAKDTSDANAIAQSAQKKNKRRKLDADPSTNADEKQDSEIQQIPSAPACLKKSQKTMARKAARQLLLELGEVQSCLREVETNSQLEGAVVALRRLQAAESQKVLKDILGALQRKEQSESLAEDGRSPVPIHSAAEKCVASALDADVPQAADKPKHQRKRERAVKYSFAEWPLVNQKKASKRRTALAVEIEDGECVPPPILAFSELQILPTWMDKALEENHWAKPTAIQAQALPILLTGRSIVGVAQTGSGKTGAFLIPAIVHIDAQEQLSKHFPGPVALILAPTRELAVQISEEADKLLKYSNQSTNHPQGIFSTCFYGGGRKQDQLWRFSSSGRHIVVATPGRLADCVSASEVSMSRVTYLVLDEADRMLDDGFSGELGQILSGVRTERQVALFSATWPTSVQELAKTVMPGQVAPVRIRVGGSAKASEEGALQARKGITQEVVVIDYPSSDWQKATEEKSRRMEAHVRKVLTSVADSKMLVFVNTKVQADDLSTKLWKEGFQADSMHGGRPQETRLNVLRKFREGQLRLLVVTDVFARGLDIPEVSHVVIFEMGETEDYIHRIGRTGRGVGGTGHALVFFEYWAGYPAGAEELIGVLERSEQKVPEALRRIVADVSAGKRPLR